MMNTYTMWGTCFLYNVGNMHPLQCGEQASSWLYARDYTWGFTGMRNMGIYSVPPKTLLTCRRECREVALETLLGPEMLLGPYNI